MHDNIYIIIPYKIRIYPNKIQSEIIKANINACKYVYNKYLYERNKYYEETHKILNWRDYRSVIKEMRKCDEFSFLKTNIYKHSLDKSLQTVDNAFKLFFKGICGYPKFKRKKDNILSYYVEGYSVYYNGNKIRLPLLGDVRITEHDYIPKDSSKYLGASIIYDSKIDKYYLTVRCYIDPNEEYRKFSYKPSEAYGHYGIDIGVKTYAYISDKFGESFQIGTDIVNCKQMKRYNDRIDYLNRINGRKKTINKAKGICGKNGWSNKCEYIQKKINKTYKKRSDFMINYINTLVMELVKAKPKSITIEDLDIKGILESKSNISSNYKFANTKLHSHVQMCMFYYFYQKLIEKSHNYNCYELRQVNRYTPSTKTCSFCGNKIDMPLTRRVYTCTNPNCVAYGLPLERDYNSARYLANCKKYIIL